MPYRITPLVNGEYYHVYNRGVSKIPIFNDELGYRHFIKAMLYYSIDGKKPKLSIFSPESTKLDSSKKIANVICYCLMPNHFHFILQQVKEGGITEFIRKLCNSHSKYINTKTNRVGPLFQGPFKAIHVEAEEQLLHLSRYIHLNPHTAFLTNNLEDYKWSSYNEYINPELSSFCEKRIILDLFKKGDDYKQFVWSRADYARELETIKHQLIDVEE